MFAHEAGHVDARHGLRQLYAAVGIFVVMGMVSSDPGHLADTVATQAGALQMLSCSRDFERVPCKKGRAPRLPAQSEEV